MANMSYCAIENVLQDIRQLIEFINEGKKDDVNEYEFDSAKQLIEYELDELKELLEDNLDNWKQQNE
jgi:hypothetical protein